MGALRLILLGPPQIFHADRPVTFHRRRSLALLAYLALANRPLTRDSLAFLLAGDVPADQARKHLRNALTDLRTLIGDHLLITPQPVPYHRDQPSSLDGHAHEPAARDAASLPRPTLEHALALATDALLAGLELRDASAFDDWRARARERLRPLVVHLATTLVS